MICVNCGSDCQVLSKGVAINRAAYLSSQMLTIQAQVVAWKKEAKRTPPKTLVKEKEKVKQAAILAEQGEKRLVEMKAEIIALYPISQWWPDALLGEPPSHSTT